MSEIIIRKASLNDITGIQNIHRDCEDPYHDIDECKAWVEKRIERGFYIQIALIENKIIGHAEWIISKEPEETYLYLGLLQIDSEYQGQGIGRRMVENGVKYAKENNCSKIVTIPEADNTSVLFYQKCGFVEGRRLYVTELPVQRNNENLECFDFIPEEIISKHRFIFGLAQISSQHMYECVNKKPITDDRLSPCIKCHDGSWIQLSYFQGDKTALALCWSNNPDHDLINNALKLGYMYELETIEFIIFEKEKQLFDNAVFAEGNIEMYMNINLQ